MSSGQDLYIAMSETRKLLSKCLDFYKVGGRKLAEAEMKYRIAYRKEILRLHEEDNVAWTVCDDLAKGDEHVATLRFNRDVAKSDYESCKEKILQLKTEIRIIEGEIEAERRGM